MRPINFYDYMKGLMNECAKTIDMNKHRCQPMTESNEQRQLKFRLIKDGEVVGYEVHVQQFNGMFIFHTKDSDTDPTRILSDLCITQYRHMNIGNPYIPHTSKDQWTGKRYEDGSEVYDGDIALEEDGEMIEIYYCNRTHGYWGRNLQSGRSDNLHRPLKKVCNSQEDPDREVENYERT